MVLLPIFRGVDWTHNVLCMADKLLEDFSNEKLKFAWFLSPRGSNYLQIYTEIIEHVMKSYNNIIFHGSSAGGFPSLYFSCIFHQKALILNAQFYIERYSLFNSFTKSTDMILTKDFEEHSSEDIVAKFGPPLCAYIWCNQNDKNHISNQFLPFKEFVESKEREKMKNHFVFRTFSNAEAPPPGKIHHSVYVPTGTTINNQLNELFDKQLN